ncbi:MAG: DUF692 domain-containing protein [Gammaproteobacteria bacterium]|nr:DUF692 domain-containing protein [Gammaproteobacteria bacterium]
MTTGLPPNAGVCLKPEHYEQALAPERVPAWFEVHAENYMGDGGPAHLWLDRARARVPLSIHGVGLSIGSAAGPDPDHLERLCRVVRRFEPAAVSEHLAWSTHEGLFFNDLLPLPYDDETLGRVADHVDLVQNRLGRQILLENPSSYLRFDRDEYPEVEFLAEISRRSGCGLLLDVNNVHVSATNLGDSAEAYLDAFPLDRVGEIHLAGHAVETDTDGRPLLIDTHDREVCDAVWKLYEHTVLRTGPVPTLIEWDARIPEWSVLVRQAELADRCMDEAGTRPPHAVTG